MLKTDLGENRGGMKKMIEMFGKILSKEMPAPVSNVTVEPAKITLPGHPPKSGPKTIRGRVTKRDVDGFMEDFELIIT